MLFLLIIVACQLLIQNLLEAIIPLVKQQKYMKQNIW